MHIPSFLCHYSKTFFCIIRLKEFDECKNSTESCSYNWFSAVFNHYTDCEIMRLSVLLIWRKPRETNRLFRLMCFIKCRRILVQNPVGQIWLKMMMMMNFCSVSGLPHDNRLLGCHITQWIPIWLFGLFIIVIIRSIFGQIARLQKHTSAEHVENKNKLINDCI